MVGCVGVGGLRGVMAESWQEKNGVNNDFRSNL